MRKTERYPWLWDVDMDNSMFDRLLRDEGEVCGFDMDWAMLRLIEYAPYREIKRLLSPDTLLRRWPALISKVRSPARRDGVDFFVAWIQRRRSSHA